MARNPKKRICVLNGGGDCPGLNAVIRSVFKTAILRYDWKVWGSEDSFNGFLKSDKMVSLTLDSVRGILPLGGSPRPFDRLLGTRFGVVAVELAAQARFGQMVALKCGKVVSVPIENAITRQHLVDLEGEYVRATKAIGISFGDV